MKCSECDLEFGNEKVLSIHMKIMHKEKQTLIQPKKASTDSKAEKFLHISPLVKEHPELSRRLIYSKGKVQNF